MPCDTAILVARHEKRDRPSWFYGDRVSDYCPKVIRRWVDCHKVAIAFFISSSLTSM
ncbi:hypothetical protein [Nostoc sp. 2RC]|uniref:hypothetical protein n=1 Tax=Nostoc sp. 2RC TaxID=2485484 RepID=UPI001627668F|nr:hypothetical protein [Nostoc sp. 2RC]MBC1235663.1 hypothetical protein [Nostoc sp. 2RC]